MTRGIAVLRQAEGKGKGKGKGKFSIKNFAKKCNEVVGGFNQPNAV